MIEKSKYEETQVKLSEQPAKSVYPVLNEKTEDNFLVSADSESTEAAPTAEQPNFLRVTPHQFVREKSGKYEPTVRPNFWIPLILLFASLVPFVIFGTVFVVVKEVQLLPVHYMTDPTNPFKVLRLLAFFIYLSVPSLISLVIASFLLKANRLPKAMAFAVWILSVVMTCSILLFFLTPKEF